VRVGKGYSWSVGKLVRKREKRKEEKKRVRIEKRIEN